MRENQHTNDFLFNFFKPVKIDKGISGTVKPMALSSVF